MQIIGSFVDMPIGCIVTPSRKGEGVTDGAGNLHTELKVRIIARASIQDYFNQFLPHLPDEASLKLAFHPEARFYRCEIV